MTFWDVAMVAVGCMVTREPLEMCLPSRLSNPPAAIAASPTSPVRTGDALDVILSAKAALVWDFATNQILYEREAAQRRPIASLVKLLSALVVRDTLSPKSIVQVPPEAASAQRGGADVGLPIGHHATVQDLLAASLIASANDAIVTLAHASKGSEQAFVQHANEWAVQHGLSDTAAINATGLGGGNQYSSASDIMMLLTMAYRDPLLRPLLRQDRGVITTPEGFRRSYQTTNQLLGTYLPILAAKTGYTPQADENIALVTQDAHGHTIGLVVLGSSARFQDAKTLAAWVWRNYTWN